MKRYGIGILLLAALTGFSGCASMIDCLIECEMSARDKILAQKTWGHWSWCYDDLEHPVHFSRGFKAGYRNVLAGGNGCQPALPPECYWKACYQTPEGKCKVYAWFDGFSHGVLAAKQDGYDDMGAIPISPRVKQNLQMSRKYPEHNMLFEGLEESDEAVDSTALEETLRALPPATDGSEAGIDATPLVSPPETARPYDE